jgi:TolB-like protein/Tfp pilus assembly protein PilF
VIRQLRVLADLAVLHRSLPADPDAPLSRRLREPLATPAIGKWGHLSLLERLGGGTFGEVYRAWDPELEREVALKLLRPGESPEDPLASRIAREGRLLARVRHPNVITVYGVGAHEGRVGLWMELVRGATLEQTLGARGPFSAREAAIIGVDLCRALAAVHSAGLIHRDVKAQNVMREDGGRIVLMDLGTGREAGAAEHALADMAGTPLYLAPEVLDGAPASARTDVYGLGVLLYHLVTGTFPVRATTLEELRDGHARGKSVRLRDVRADLPTTFVNVVDRAIAHDAAVRYDSAGALEADLVRALDATVLPRAEAPAAIERPRRAIRWRTWGAAAALIVLAAAAGLLWPTMRGGRTPAVAPPTIRSIAVLPLANLSGDPSQEYFADGMTEELIAQLGTLAGLDVISRTSVMQFKGSSKPLPDIARMLNVDAVLEGSVIMLAGTGGGDPAPPRNVRIHARLIAAGTDTRLWDRTFEAVIDDVLSLQSRVAKAVAEGIKLRLSDAQQAALAGGGRQIRNFEAFDLYLRGRYYWNLRTRDDLNRSIDYFKKAIEADPNFAAAHAGLSDAYVLLGALYAMPFDESLAAARAAVTRALALEDSLAEGHASLAVIQDNQLEWQAADASFTRALQLNPGFARAHHWYAAHLAQRGRFAEALAAIQRASELDPLSPSVQTQRAAILFLSRRYDETIEQAAKALRLDPRFARAHLFIAEAHTLKREFERALDAIDKAASAGGRTAELDAFSGCTNAMAGREKEARAVADDLIQRYQSTRDGSPVGIGMVYACLRDADRSIEWLQRARTVRDPWLAYLAVSPFFDSLRQDARFAALVAELGLTR